MNVDFTLGIYSELVRSLLSHKYKFLCVREYLSSTTNNYPSKLIIMRHDVDQLPKNARRIAELESKMGVVSTYYFRMVPDTFDISIINEIRDFGHEIGYHYENLSHCRGDYNKAIKDLEYKLEKFRELYPVKTICMHGSPLSKWDNRDLWNEYEYRDFGIIGEPYFDIDFEEIFYISDTGRRWDGKNVSVRDKVAGGGNNNENRYHSTHDIIASVEEGSFPDRAMMTVHPQRWTNNPFLWVNELILQNIKNVGKYILIKLRNE